MLVIIAFIIVLLVAIILFIIVKNMKTHVVEVLNFNKCKVELCTSHYYPEMGIPVYSTVLLLNKRTYISDSHDVFKACKKYKGQNIVCDIDMSIQSDGTSKIVVKSLAEKTFDKPISLNGYIH